MAKERTTGSVFEIDITVQNNTLVVGTNGGNVTAIPGNRVLWAAPTSGPPFTLEFFQVASEASIQARKEHSAIHVDVAALPRWPFSDPPQPENGVVGPTHVFAGVLAGDFTPPTAFKYYVTVGNLRLDPIIIVDE